jgi:hypothetical protein
LRCFTNESAAAFDTIERLNGDHLDAAWIDGEVVVEGCHIKIAVHGAEIGEIGSATSQGKQASACRRLARNVAEGSNNGSNIAILVCDIS